MQVGRTLPIWDTFGRVGPFTAKTPWLLRIFDQVFTHHPPLWKHYGPEHFEQRCK